MLRQHFFECRGHVLTAVPLPVRRRGCVRLCAWSCSPLVAARGLQLPSFCMAIYFRSSYRQVVTATSSIFCWSDVLLAARGLQYAKQGSTVHNFMYVCVISTLRNEFNLVPSPPGFYMVTNVTA